MALAAFFAAREGTARQDPPRARLRNASWSASKKSKVGRSPASKYFKGSPDQPENEVDEQGLETLNSSLAALVAIFPDVQAEVFREMLLTFTEESRLHVVTEALLRNKAKWVRGRWRNIQEGVVQGHQRPEAYKPSNKWVDVPTAQQFRTEKYRSAVKTTLYQEFRGFPRSTINAVLAEHNYSYTLTRPRLLTLSSKSWWFSLSSFLLRRKTPLSTSPGEHPLVVWRPADASLNASQVPLIHPTESQELNQELLDTLIKPLQKSLKEGQETQDLELAVLLNETEAESCNALYDCECCFTGTTFEQSSTCDRGCHFICFRCIRCAISEALFGQGWSRNVDSERGTLRCIAPALGTGSECGGCIKMAFINRALLEEKGGHDVLRKLEERLTQEGLKSWDASLVRCPFCIYAEVDEAAKMAQGWRFRRGKVVLSRTLPPLLIGYGLTLLLLPVVLLALFLFSIYIATIGSYHITNSLIRLSRKRRGLKFTCASPHCGRSSCLSCGKEWRDIHICYESEQLALRAHVERAMAEAVKRTCPRCNISFIKASGCNKLTCVCGYQMCYVCRSEIGTDGYRHFCEHFRPLGKGSCPQCDKCDLYRCEDEAMAVRRAGDKAEREWRVEHRIRGTISWNSKGDLPRPFVNRKVTVGDGLWKSTIGRAMELKTWQDILDAMVDILVEVP